MSAILTDFAVEREAMIERQLRLRLIPRVHMLHVLRANERESGRHLGYDNVEILATGSHPLQLRIDPMMPCCISMTVGEPGCVHHRRRLAT